MKTKVALWIDHRKAIILTVTDDGSEAIKTIISNVEKQLSRSGDSPFKGKYESQQAPPSDSRQKSFTGHINIYYDAVTACIRESEDILIFGPGEAKGELIKRLKKNKIKGRIADIETVDRMTERQIAAKVRKYFHNPDKPEKFFRSKGKARSAKRKGKRELTIDN